jgi:acyl transferase domain-containing protein
MSHAVTSDSAVEGIAVIGMSGRFPGAGTLDQFWHNLCDGVDSISFFSEQEMLSTRVNQATLRSAKYVRAAGVLDHIEDFDAAFFGFSPREVEIMDPQHRLFLEITWEALEDAGYDTATYRGAVGVYAGMSMSKYLLNNLLPNQALAEAEGPLQLRILNDKDFLASLVAYKLNLRGPSINVQTACATSLVAVAQACQGLLNYQCDLALAGGVSIGVPQRAGYLAQEGVFSPDGRCRAFDAAAQGTVGGNGGGAVVLKRLEDALAEGDQIYAVIKGSAINNDGALKVGYTAPSLEGQFEAIAMAQAVAGVDPATIGYIETHGTGTPLGDMIEVEALTQAFRVGTARTGFCAIGSVKPNIGHLDAAAGIASLIKTVLALRHGLLPPSLHFSEPNPQIDFANSPFYVNTALAEWQAEPGPRRAGVSAFAIGGVNAHVIIEEAPEVVGSDPAAPWQLLVLSARTSSALEVMTDHLVGCLRQHAPAQIADVAYTLQVGRQAFEHRRMLLCTGYDDGLDALERRDPKRILTSICTPHQRPIAFMFPGLGNHYVNMALELYQSEPVFREQLDRACELLTPHLGLDLRTLLYPASEHATLRPAIAESTLDLRAMLRPDVSDAVVPGRLHQTSIAQPALFVIEYALAQLWMAWGIRPQALIGYSVGEYVAACLAGVIALEDALLLVARRAQLIQALPPGAMLAVPLTEAAVGPYLGPTVSLAAITGPELCVLAGPPDAIGRLERQLSERGLACRRLQAAHAFHSTMMEPIVGPFAELFQSIELHPPAIPYISSVTGTWISAAQATDPGYWVQQLCRTVRFADGVRELWQEPDRIMLEIGPGQVLGAWALQHPASAEVTEPIVLASLRHAYDQQSDRALLLTTLGRLWLAGVPIEWAARYGAERRLRVALPTYPFERQRYWIEPPQPLRDEADRVLPLSKHPDIAAWFFAPVWKQSALYAPLNEAALAAQPRRWLVFADACGVGAQLVERLGRAGHLVTAVAAGAQFRQTSERSYMIRPESRDDYATLLAALRQDHAAPETILHLWGVTPDCDPPSGQAFVERCLERGFYSLMYLAQALGDQGGADPLYLAIIASGLYDVIGDERLHPAKATALGPCQVIPLEYPHITCGCIDIVAPAAGAGLDRRGVDQLLAEVAAPSGDRNIAYRGRRRWTQSFEPVRRTPAAAPRLREGGVYLITGGLGGIGLVLAEHLARSLRARLVLVGRSFFPPRTDWQQWLAAHDQQDAISRKIHALLAIEECGAEILVIAADVTDQIALRGAVAQTQERYGALHGVIHAAGVMPGGMIQLKTDELAAPVLAPKLWGTLALAEALAGLELDFLVLCSSLNAVIGGFGLVDHCAANAFLDAFAHQRHAQGDPYTLSINWDAWQEVGQAARAAAGERHISAAAQPAREEAFDHPLLDCKTIAASGQETYLTEWSAARHWVLNEHRIHGYAVMPGTAYIEMIRAVAARRVPAATVVLDKVRFAAPLMLRDDEQRSGRVVLSVDGDSFTFVIASQQQRPDAASLWVEHVTGTAQVVPAGERISHPLAAIKARCVPDQREHAGGSPQQRGEFGPRWRGLTWQVWVGMDEALVEIALPEQFASDLDQFQLHPALLDAATGFVQGAGDGIYVPLAYERLTIHAALPRTIYSYVRRKSGDLFEREIIACDISIVDEHGTELLAIENYTLRKVTSAFAAGALVAAPARATHQDAADWADAPLPGPLAAAQAQLLKDGITPAEGAEVFRRLLSGAALPQVVVSTRDLAQLITHLGSFTTARALEELQRASGRARHARPGIPTTYVAPRSELEIMLTSIWQDLLNIEQVGIHDNFFDSGGDSLLATRLIAQLEEQFQIDLPLRVLFEVPTVAELAPAIVARQAEQIDDDALAQALAEIKHLSTGEPQTPLAAAAARNDMEVSRE